MKNRNSLKILTSLVAVVFILSMFAGMAAAQNPKEQYGNAKDQYQMLKDNYDNAKKNYQEAKDSFNSAKQNFKSARSNLSKDELKVKTQDYLARSIDYMIAHLEILKDRANTEKAYLPFDAAANIDSHITELNNIKSNVQAANTTQELSDAARQLDDTWKKINLEARYYAGLIVNKKIDQFILNADNATRMDSIIQRLKDQGKDVTTLEGYASSFNTFMSEAKTNHQNELSMYGSHNGFDSNGLVTDNQAALAFIQEATSSQKDTIRKLRSAAEQYSNFFREAKNMVPVVKGTGKLEANGTGTAIIRGNVTVTLTVSGNATMTVSSNAEVTVDGTGTKEVLGNGDVKYQGFGTATVTGTGIRVDISGDNISLTAEGSGTALLRGKGTYHAEKELTGSGDWTKVD